MTSAITLLQPLASLVAEGVVTVLTFPRPAPVGLVGEELLIHAGAATRHLYGTVGEWSVHRWGEKGPEVRRLGAVVDGPRLNPNRFRDRLAFPLPFSAVVASYRLQAWLPIDDFDAPARVERDPDGLWLYPAPGKPARDITDQLPYGDFTPGRWAWIITDVRKLATPVPCRGHAGVWSVPEEVERAITG